MVARKLRNILEELRKLPFSGGYCSIGHRPLQDAIFWSGNEKEKSSMNGPFDTEEEVNEAMIKKYIFNGLPRQKAAFYKRTLKQIFHGHPPVFTHGDLQRKNIMVRGHIPEQAGKEDEFKLTLLDWEVAGWYPSYWEYSRAMLGCGKWDDDWHVCLSRMVDKFLPEWAWADMMFKELWS